MATIYDVGISEKLGMMGCTCDPVHDRSEIVFGKKRADIFTISSLPRNDNLTSRVT